MIQKYLAASFIAIVLSCLLYGALHDLFYYNFFSDIWNYALVLFIFEFSFAIYLIKFITSKYFRETNKIFSILFYFIIILLISIPILSVIGLSMLSPTGL